MLVGINDYTASRLGRPHAAPAERREWPNLYGAVNDVTILREMLIERYGFASRDVVVLADQEATRASILEAIERHLVKPAKEDDVLFFYYAGHGSQVRNSLSEELDGLDESIVPADSRLGASDIRDKELRPLFNRILDRGARLTVILDACHSGSGVRGRRPRVRPRWVRRDDRDVADGSRGQRPEDRGALVLAAAQDYDRAWERRDEDGRMHGAFSWALIRAMRDAAPSEPAEETFLRAQARLRGEMPFQEPVLSGNASARRTPFLGVSSRETRPVVAVERVRSDGTVVVQGGWAHGLSVGSELRVGDARLTITALLGAARSEARVDSPRAVRPGALADVVRREGRPWHRVASQAQAPYRLVVEDGRLVLRGRSSAPPRHYYVLAIDARGSATLVYPRSGSVENRFPVGTAMHHDIELGAIEPADIESLVLLSTEEPLPNPWILETVLPSQPPVLASASWTLEKISPEDATKCPQRCLRH